jgi:hypothetical protein
MLQQLLSWVLKFNLYETIPVKKSYSEEPRYIQRNKQSIVLIVLTRCLRFVIGIGSVIYVKIVD